MSLRSKINKGIDWACTCVYFFQVCMDHFGNPFKKLKAKRDKPIYVLANGPSVKLLLEKIEKNPDTYKNYDFSVINDFVNNPIIEKVKPKYVTMSDPLFFTDTILSDRGHKAMNSLAEKIKWDTIFFIPKIYRNSKYLEPVKKNPHIKIVVYHSCRYRGSKFTSFALYLFKRGLGNGEFGTVVQNAMYAAMMMGYNELDVYGIDHNYFDSLAVNDQNVPCFKEKHFYKEESEWKPIVGHDPADDSYDKPYTMTKFLREQAGIFKGHLLIEQLAKSMGIKIYNCTPNSMVDAYERKMD